MTLAVDALRGDLRSWGERSLRDLPWRRSRDGWEILVAELMLQQTQVSRVRDRWPAFLERFPDPAAAAAAPRAELVRAWAGLGYNRRAVHLHLAATLVVEAHGGQVPDTLDDLLTLPGVGPYTARAVLAFAHERDVGVVDTNVGRILARWGGSALTVRGAQSLADELVPAGEGWRWNQTMLDLGALICTSRSPQCRSCPVSRVCAWGGVGDDPARGSAAVSVAQAAFAGSDRQGRGRLVDALRVGPVPGGGLAEAIGWDDERRAEDLAGRLVADGLARWDGTSLVLA